MNDTARRPRRMSEERFESNLRNLLQRVLQRSGGQVHTFAETGVLTMNRGLVVTLASGQEFQITIVESTRY